MLNSSHCLELETNRLDQIRKHAKLPEEHEGGFTVAMFKKSNVHRIESMSITTNTHLRWKIQGLEAHLLSI